MNDSAATPPESGFELGIFVSNLDRSTHFYTDLLGFALTGEVRLPGVTMRRLTRGHSVLKLVEMAEEATTSNPAGTAIGLRYVTVFVADAAGATARCTAAGAELLRPLGEFRVPGEGLARARTAIVADPDGNRVELCQGSAWQATG